jgi:hypothetical protein
VRLSRGEIAQHEWTIVQDAELGGLMATCGEIASRDMRELFESCLARQPDPDEPPAAKAGP